MKLTYIRDVHISNLCQRISYPDRLCIILINPSEITIGRSLKHAETGTSLIVYNLSYKILFSFEAK
jgi:hypothetical protein